MSLLEWLKFWSKFYRIPLFWNTVSEYPPPNENCHRSWHFDFSVSEYPPPRKLKFGQILALWLYSFRIPPPKKNCQRSWHFDFSVSEYLPPKIEIWADLGTLTLQFQNTPPKWKLSEMLALWLFSFRIPPLPKIKIVRYVGTLTFQFQNTPPPPPKKLKFGQILALWLYSFRIPPPPKNWNLGRSWHFSTLRLFSFRTMCGKLPHVETLSSPDNYSFLSFSHSVTHHLDKWWLLSNMTKSWQVLNIIWHADSHSFQAHSIGVKFLLLLWLPKQRLHQIQFFLQDKKYLSRFLLCIHKNTKQARSCNVTNTTRNPKRLLYHHYLVHGTWKRTNPASPSTFYTFKFCTSYPAA